MTKNKILRLIKAGLIVCAIMLLASCKSENVIVDPPPLESFTFANSQIQMWADRRHVAIDSAFHIRQMCKPLYSGKGTLELRLLGGGRTVIIDSPTKDTLSPNTDGLSKLPVLFAANEDFLQSWTVRLHGPNNISYGFEGYVRMDSILIRGRFFATNSKEADSVAPIGNRFRPYASTFDVLVIETP